MDEQDSDDDGRRRQQPQPVGRPTPRAGAQFTKDDGPHGLVRGSAVLFHVTADVVVVAHRDEHGIATVDAKEDAQFESGAEFQKRAEAPQTQPGMDVRLPKRGGELRRGLPDLRLILRRELFEGAIEGGKGEDVHTNFFNLPLLRARSISVSTFFAASRNSFCVRPYSSNAESSA